MAGGGGGKVNVPEHEVEYESNLKRLRLAYGKRGGLRPLRGDRRALLVYGVGWTELAG